MKKMSWVLAITLALAACGGATPPEEETSAEWTSGDDDALAGEAEPSAAGSEP
ncbi:MAG: hypothetical protein AB7S26_34395 [Sandaracinaceae bacterium]